MYVKKRVLEENSEAIKTAIELIDNTVSGNELQVDVISQPPISISEVDIKDPCKAAQTNDIKITLDGESVTEVNSSGIKTDTANIKSNLDTIKSDIASILSDTTAIKTAIQIIDDWDSNNNCKSDQQPKSKNYVYQSMAASGTIISGSSGVKIRIYKVWISNATTGYCTLDFQDGSGGATKFFCYVPQGGSFTWDFFPFYIELSTNTALYLSFALIPSPRAHIHVIYEYV